MVKRRQRFVHPTTTLQDRISTWAVGIREQAATMKPGRERDELLKKVEQAETAMHLQDWAYSPGPQPLK